MIPSTSLAESVQQAFRPTPRGVLGLVDDVLGLCRVHQLHLRFADGHCRVHRLGTKDEDALRIDLPKSVFRAALARIAALCNEQHPGSVTPYCGECELVVAAPHATNASTPFTCLVSFRNTASDQQLDVRFSRMTAIEGYRFTILLRDQRIVTVSGHALKYQTDSGSYGIVSNSSGREVLVAIFPAEEVIGMFSGDFGYAGGSGPATVGPNTSSALTARELQRQEAINPPNGPI